MLCGLSSAEQWKIRYLSLGSKGEHGVGLGLCGENKGWGDDSRGPNGCYESMKSRVWIPRARSDARGHASLPVIPEPREPR